MRGVVRKLLSKGIFGNVAVLTQFVVEALVALVLGRNQRRPATHTAS